MNKLFEAGLHVIPTSYYDYYFRLGLKKPALDLETYFIHAVLLSTLSQHADAPALAIFLQENRDKLDHLKLKDLARIYRISSEFDALRAGVSYYEKIRDNK